MKYAFTSTLLIAATSIFASGDPRKREQIGEVLGQPVYRDQINATDAAGVRDQLHRLFTVPVMLNYREAHRNEIDPTKDEFRLAVIYFRRTLEERYRENPDNGVGAFAVSMREVDRIAKQLDDSSLGDVDRRQLEEERRAAEKKLDEHVTSFATFWLSGFKFQRHLYYRYGGGRALWQQAGLEAFDAMHCWLTEREEKADFKITDPELRAEFYAYWTTMHHGAFLSKVKDKIDPLAFQYPWLKEPVKDSTAAVPAKESAGPDSMEQEPNIGVFDRIEAKEFVLRGNDGRTRARIGVDSSDVVRFSANSDTQSDAFLLSVFPDGRVALLLRDGDGKNRVGMSTHEGGRPVVTLSENANIILRDDRGRNRAVLRVSEDGSPELALYDDKGRATRVTPEPAP